LSHIGCACPAACGILGTVKYDALLVLGFGGPEKIEDVLPFLERVTRGRGVPRERLEEVAQNYYRFGGRSPINDHCRSLIAALREELSRHGRSLPVYWGNRNWYPLVEDTVVQMKADGVRRALFFAISAYSSYSSCKQYREDIERARAAAGEGAPEFDKIRHFYNLPGFVEPLADRLRESLAQIPEDRRGTAHLLFTAHSIPVFMAETSRYEAQLDETARLVAAGAGHPSWRLVWQSRSGPPSQPWLEPDIRDALSEIAAQPGSRDVIVQPIGFLSDHMEVLVDLDWQAREHAESLGLRMVRARTVGNDPRFIQMICELIEEREAERPEAEGCLQNCCPNPHLLRAGAGRPAQATGAAS
jgi:ferrochelatase